MLGVFLQEYTCKCEGRCCRQSWLNKENYVLEVSVKKSLTQQAEAKQANVFDLSQRVQTGRCSGR